MPSFASLRQSVAPALVAAALALSATAARADPISTTTSIALDFNSLGNNANNAAVQSYLQGALGSGATITGALALQGYTGDGHVVGPVSGSTVTPYTLGTTDGGVAHGGSPDTFIVNDSSGKFTINLPFKVYGVSFDYEIFPDGTPNQPPDMTFKADGTVVFHLFGVLPGTGGTFPHSPVSGTGATEGSAQLLGSYSGAFPNGVTKLEFIDWPDRVGIDNLQLNPTPAPAPVVPEPLSMAAWLGVLAGGGAVARRLRRRNLAPATPAA